MEFIYMIYSPKAHTYEIGGGSSTPSRERVFYSYEQAQKIRDRWFKGHEIHTFRRHEVYKPAESPAHEKLGE